MKPARKNVFTSILIFAVIYLSACANTKSIHHSTIGDVIYCLENNGAPYYLEDLCQFNVELIQKSDTLKDVTGMYLIDTVDFVIGSLKIDESEDYFIYNKISKEHILLLYDPLINKFPRIVFYTNGKIDSFMDFDTQGNFVRSSSYGYNEESMTYTKHEVELKDYITYPTTINDLHASKQKLKDAKKIVEGEDINYELPIFSIFCKNG